MKSDAPFDINRASTIWAILLLAAVTPAPAVLGPLLVGAYVTNLGFTPQQGGYLIASELIGAALSTFSTLYIVGRFNWHKVLTVSVLIIIIAYLVSALLIVGGFAQIEVLLPVRFVSGLALGTIMTMTIVVSGMTKDQERTFGFWSLGQIIFAVVGFALLPKIFPAVGVKGFFLMMAVFMTFMLLPIRFMPPKGTEEHKQGLKSIPRQAKRLVPLGLLALLLFYTAIGGVWAYVERIANAAHIEADFIGYTLSAASLFGVAGAGAATWISTRFGRFLPAVFGYITIGVGMFLVFGLQSTVLYAASSLIFKFGWWFTSPYVLANMTNLDPSGRTAIFTNFVVACGMGLGPAVAATILSLVQGEDGGLNYNAVIIFGGTCLSLSLPLLYPIVRENSKKG